MMNRGSCLGHLSITWDVASPRRLYFSSSSFLLLLRFNSPTIKFILLKRTVDGMVFFSSQVFSSPIPLNPVKFPVLGSLYMLKVKLHAIV